MLFGPREQAEETDALGTQDTQSGPEPGDEGMAIASRHLETPGQRQEAGRMVSVTAPTGPSVAFSAPSVALSPVRTDI